MATQQPIFFDSRDTSHATTTEYLPPSSVGRSYVPTESDASVVFPTSGTIKQLNVLIDTAPGSGKSRKFGVYVNGVLSTTVWGHIRDSSTSLTVTTDQSISTGDTVSIGYVPQGTPSNFTRLDGSIIFEPTTDDEYVVLSLSGNALASGATEYNQISSIGGFWNTSQSFRKQLLPVTGTVKNFTVHLSATPGVSDNYVFTVQTAASEGAPSDTSVTVTLDNADFDKTNSSNTAAVTASDVVSLKCVGSATAAAVTAKWSFVYSPTTTGEIPSVGGNSLSNVSVTVNNYTGMSERTAWNATESVVDHDLENTPITVKAMYVETNSSISSGSYLFRINKDGVSQSALDVTITSAGLSGNAVSDVSFSSGEKFSVLCDPSTPSNPRAAMVAIRFTYAGITTPTEPAFAREVIHFTKDDTGTANAMDHIPLSGNFTPKAVIVYGSLTTSTGISDGNYNLTYGFSDGTNDRCVTGYSRDNVGTSSANCVFRDDGVICMSQASATVLMLAELDSFVFNAFRLKWTTNNSTANRFTAVVLGGTQLSFEALTWTTDTTSGAHTEDVTSPTMANAEFGIFITPRVTVVNTFGTHSRTAVGFSDGSSNVCVACNSWSGVVTTSTDRQFYSSKAVSNTLNGADVGAASITFDADGFNAIWDANKDTNAYKIGVLLAKGGQWEVGSGQDRDTTEGTGVEAYTTAFQPELLQIISHNRITADSWQPSNVFNVGSSDGTTEGNIAVGDANGQGTSDCCRNYSTTKILERITNIFTPAIGATANVNGFNATDFSLNFTAVDTAPQDRWFGWWIAAEAVAASTVPVLDEGMLMGGFQPLAGGLY